jgi:SAM-dependent methyltransferase
MHYEPAKPFDGYDGEQSQEYEAMKAFIDGHEGPQAKLIGEWCLNYLKPSSVIDLGCSTGIYLRPFVDAGCEVLGLDAVAGGGKALPQPEVQFQRFDLRFPYKPCHRFDLVMCLEVAEHLERHWAERLVDTICDCGDTVLFTGATPGQGGSFHLNEQPHEFWLELFQVRHNYHIHSLQNTFREYVNSVPDAYPGSNPPVDEPPGCTGWMKRNSFLLCRM